MSTIKDVLFRDSPRLSQALSLQAAESRLEIRVLLEHALNVDRAWLLTHDDQELNGESSLRYESFLARRLAGEPIAYILGRREFYGRSFKVGPSVLIPRPETELLVEAALERLPKDRPARVLDLGTGSGCIALTLALERPLTQVVAADASPASLTIARENARKLGAENIEFILSDWYLGLGVNKFDMIVSNPPYISGADPHLDAGDLRFEPRQALSSGADGLDAVRIIVANAPEHLHNGGWLLLEHGFDQAEATMALLDGGGVTAIFTMKDLARTSRVTGGQLSGNFTT